MSEGTLTKFFMVIKLFELDTSVRESAKQLDLAYNTVYRLFQILRYAIVIADTDPRSFTGEIEMDESYFGGRKKVTGTAELRERSRYLGFWNEVIR